MAPLSTLLQMLAAAPSPARPDSILDTFPWLPDFIALFLGLGIVAFLIYMFRPGGVATGFNIIVDEEDITFTGDFPAYMQQTVTDFLRNDCQIPGSYRIRGHWEERMLIVVVQGEQALPLEQRIRNFLKLNLKSAGRATRKFE